MHKSSHSRHFLLDPEITFLNFGSFGACPLPVFKDYQQWQLQLEREPVQFLTVSGLQQLDRSRSMLAEFVGCDSKNLVYVVNPSYAANIVARSFPLQPGDEVLTTALEYGACDRTWEYYCNRKGAKLVRQNINLPLRNKNAIVDELFSGATGRTKLLFISHITSSTALVLPVAEICARAKELGIPVFVDGAHAPGQVPLKLDTLGADMYTGACHKWMMAPKGCSFFFAKQEWHTLLDPLVISWGYNSSAPGDSLFVDYHQGQGTRDFSAFLSVPAAIDFMRVNDWTNVSAGCRTLAHDNARRFAGLLNTALLAEPGSEFLGQMVSLPVKTQEPQKLQALLFSKYRIEIPVMPHGDRIFLRYSVNAFNSQNDLDRLYSALDEIIQEGSLIRI